MRLTTKRGGGRDEGLVVVRRDGAASVDAGAAVRLPCLANDLTFRFLVPAELAKGFGFLRSKPATASSPFAATPDELGPAWRDGRVHLRLAVRWSGRRVGDLEAGPEMRFSFPAVVAHAARTRALTAGTIVGGGTVSNAAPGRCFSCIAERRARELPEEGAARTRFLLAGDTLEIEMRAAEGQSVFGAIAQRVVTA